MVPYSVLQQCEVHKIFIFMYFIVIFKKKIILEKLLEERKIIIKYPKWGKWANFGSKIDIFEVFLNLFFRFFWNFPWWQALKIASKSEFLILEKNCYYSQNEESSTFLGPKSALLNFSVNLLIRFPWNCTRLALKSGLKWMFCMWKENS